MKRVKLQVERLPHSEGLPLPRYMTEGAAGMDVCAALEGELVLRPGERTLVPTGLKFAVPPGYELQIRPRSGLALKNGLSLLNSPGTLDSDYRGELKLILANLGSEPFTLRRGDRIAQLVLAPVVQAELDEVDDLPPTGRAEGGFGHTGTSAGDSDQAALAGLDEQE